MKKSKLEELLERECRFSRSLWDDNKKLRQLLYEPLSKDEQIKIEAVDFGKFLITMNVTMVSENLYKTNTGMAPDMLRETMEQLWDRHIKSKI